MASDGDGSAPSSSLSIEVEPGLVDPMSSSGFCAVCVRQTAALTTKNVHVQLSAKKTLIFRSLASLAVASLLFAINGILVNTKGEYGIGPAFHSPPLSDFRIEPTSPLYVMVEGKAATPKWRDAAEIDVRKLVNGLRLPPGAVHVVDIHNENLTPTNMSTNMSGIIIVNETVSMPDHRWELTIRLPTCSGALFRMLEAGSEGGNKRQIVCAPSTQTTTNRIMFPIDNLPFATYGFLSLQEALFQSASRLPPVPYIYTLNNITFRSFTRETEAKDFRQKQAAFLSSVFPAAAPIIHSFLFANMFFTLTVTVTVEKQERLTETLKIMGMQPVASVCSHILSSVLFFIPVLMISSLFLQVILHETSFGSILSLQVSFALVLMSCAFIICSISSSARVSGALALVTLLVGVGCGVGIFYGTLNESSLTGALPHSILGAAMVVVPHFAYSIALGEMGSVAADAISGSVSSSPVLSLAQNILWLDTVLFAVLAWWIDAIVPQMWGVHKPWNFPCIALSDFFCNTNKDHSRQQRQPTPGYNHLLMQDGIVTKDLVKTFGNKKAVNGLSLKAYHNSITSLLGHNGAGKSTTFGMLCGLIKPTSGDAKIMGLSIATQMQSIRSILGVCPQHDVLFKSLTPHQTLHIIGWMKGLAKPSEASSRWLRRMDLEHKAHTPCDSLSGGQRRKVSLAVALIGAPSVVILDEPSSGLDPFSRRQIWDVIQQSSVGKTIVLSTHYLDEADHLGDNITIMSLGSVQASGTPLQLKTTFGTGYSLTLSYRPQQTSVNKIFKSLNAVTPGIKLVGSAAMEIVIRIPTLLEGGIPKMLRHLETHAESIGINDYGVTMTSLEDVFLRLSRLQEEEAKETSKELGASLSERVWRNSQQDAEDYSDSDLGGNSLEGKQSQQSYEVQVQQQENDRGNKAQSSNSNGVDQVRILMYKRLQERKRQKLAICFSGSMVVVIFLVASILLENSQYTHQSPSHRNNRKYVEQPRVRLSMREDAAVGNISSIAVYPNASWLLAAIPEGRTGPDPFTNVFESLSSSDIYTYVTNHLSTLSAALKTCVAGRNECDSEIMVANMDSVYLASTLLNLVHNAETLGESLMGTTFLSVTTHPFPEIQEPNVLSANIQSLLYFALVTMLAYPIMPAFFASSAVIDRTTNIRRQMRMSGARSWAYWIGGISADIFVGAVPTILAPVCLFAIFPKARYAFLSEGILAALKMILIFLAYSLAINVQNSFIASYLSTPGSVLGVLLGFNVVVSFLWLIAVVPSLMVGGPMAGFVVNCIFMAITPTPAIVWYSLLRGNLANIAAFSEPWPLSFELQASLFLVAHIVIWSAALMVKDTCFSQRVQFKNDVLIPYDDHNPASEDNDVQQMRISANAIDVTLKSSLPIPPLIVRGLRKVYPPGEDGFSRIAVHNMSLTVSKGECCALLGPNGAGKSSALNMICGDVSASQGEIFIDGVPMHSQRSLAQRNIGLCPQFDALVPELSVLEQIMLHGTLKGLSAAEANSGAEKLIQQLALETFRDSQCCVLSGGNKRRVSLAIALIGDPPVLLLDEVTCGMDAEAKRFVWDVILELRTRKAIILTSHDMAEVMATSTHVTILVDGELRCYGTLGHIRSRYGAGYNVELRGGNDQSLDEVSDLLCRQFQGSHVREKRRAFRVLEVAKTSAKASEVFEEVMRQAQSDENAIEDYSVSQSTLEQVFLSFGKLQSRSRSGSSGNRMQRVTAAQFKPSMKDWLLNLVFLISNFGPLHVVPVYVLYLLMRVVSCCGGGRVGTVSSALWSIICIQLTPFGRNLQNSPDFLLCNIDNSDDLQPPPCWFRLGLNAAWFFSFGLALAAFHIAFATINAITLVLLPFAGVHLDLALALIAPF